MASNDTAPARAGQLARAHARPSLISSAWLLGAAIFLLALIPRAIAPGVFVTVDEAYHWLERAARFRQALQSGNYAGTNLVGHPGVTTMWLGALGLELRHWLIGAGLVDGDSLFVYRALSRLPLAAATSLCVALAYAPLRRLLGAPTALLAALLWASEPFVVAHSQLLHVDALLASFVLLALLAALAAFHFGETPGPLAPRWGWLAASGVCGGLALLTKSPAVLLPPMVGLVALVGAWRAARGPRALLAPHALGRALVLPLLAWGGLAAAVWLALWPAAWLSPLGAAWSVLHQAEADGGTPHAWGNFFLGRAVADPGALFYPVVLAFRLAPWTLLGAGAGALLLWRRAVRGRAALALIAVFALLFLAMMSVPPKKFDRYVLPVFPALDIIAAAGWAQVGGLVLSRSRRFQLFYHQDTKTPSLKTLNRNVLTWPAALGWLALAAALAANLAWYHPYEIAYYSPLLGGGPAAARAIPVGWGEGYEQAGAFISAQPDGRDTPVAAWFEPVLRPFVRAPVEPLPAAATPGRVGYVVLYIDQIQRGDAPDVTAQYYGKQTPLHVVSIHGIDYAYVYRAIPAVAHALPADFGASLHLLGYDATAAAGTLALTLTWQVAAPPPADTMLFIHVFDSARQVVARADVPPGGATPADAWQAGRFVSAGFSLPAALPPERGPYWLSLGLYSPASGQRLPLGGAPTPAPGAPDDGPNALRIPLTLP